MPIDKYHCYAPVCISCVSWFMIKKKFIFIRHCKMKYLSLIGNMPLYSPSVIRRVPYFKNGMNSAVPSVFYRVGLSPGIFNFTKLELGRSGLFKLPKRHHVEIGYKVFKSVLDDHFFYLSRNPYFNSYNSIYSYTNIFIPYFIHWIKSIDLWSADHLWSAYQFYEIEKICYYLYH